jgi:hypothetical protein
VTEQPGLGDLRVVRLPPVDNRPANNVAERACNR